MKKIKFIFYNCIQKSLHPSIKILWKFPSTRISRKSNNLARLFLTRLRILWQIEIFIFLLFISCWELFQIDSGLTFLSHLLLASNSAYTTRNTQMCSSTCVFYICICMCVCVCVCYKELEGFPFQMQRYFPFRNDILSGKFDCHSNFASLARSYKVFLCGNLFWVRHYCVHRVGILIKTFIFYRFWCKFIKTVIVLNLKK